MNTLLVIWTVVAIHGGQYGAENMPRMDWRPIGVFQTPVACEQAAAALNLKRQQYRCLPNAA